MSAHFFTVFGRRALRGLLFLGCCLISLPGGPVSAAELTLVNGEVLEGMILRETPEQVVLRDINQMTIPVPRNRIASINPEETANLRIRMADRAERMGNLSEAREHLVRAIELGADRDELQKRLASIEEAEQTKALEGHHAPVGEAKEAIRTGNLDRAQRILEQEIAKEPSGSPARTALQKILAQVYHDRAQESRNSVDYAAAERFLRRAEQLDPNNPKVQIELADIAMQSTRTRERAIENYKRALEKGQGSLSEGEMLRVAYQVADLYKDKGDAYNAVRYYRMVYDADPRYKPELEEHLIRQYDLLAEAYERAGDRAAAISVLRHALGVGGRPEGAALRFRLALNLVEQGNLNDALSEFTSLLSVDPAFPQANFQYAQVLRELGRESDAEKALQRELTINPRHYDCLVDLGEFYRVRNSAEEARKYFTRAREIDADLPRATLALGKTERQLENFKDAETYIRQVLALEPKNREANLELGRLFRDQKDLEKANEFFTTVIDIIDEEATKGELRRTDKRLLADALIARGEVRLLTQGPRTAQRDFNRALEVFPNYAAAYFKIGEAYESMFGQSKRLDDLKLAEENMVKARQIEPNNPDYALGLGILYHQVLAGADAANRVDYMRKALTNYQDYISNGGTDVELVQGWIRETGGA